MRPSEILKSAQNRLWNPKRWCQKVMAKDKEGISVPFTSEFARSFCALGSVQRTLVDTDRWGHMNLYDDCMAYLESASEMFTTEQQKEEVKLGTKTGIEIVNDNCDHETVIEMFQYAIDEAIQNEKED